jgi:Anti-sigma-K factor rskA
VTPDDRSDHDQIDEILAAYVLRGLSGPDATEADRLLSDHVPTCSDCRRTLEAFRVIAADLATQADPMQPPDLLLARLHRQLAPRRRRSVQVMVVAAGVVAVVGLAGVAVAQDVRAGRNRSRAADITRALDMASRPGARMVTVGPATEISVPGSVDVFLYGGKVPEAPSGRVYRVWSVGPDGTARYLCELKVENGMAFAHMQFDPTKVVKIMITVEAKDTQPNHPGQVQWSSAA